MAKPKMKPEKDEFELQAAIEKVLKGARLHLAMTAMTRIMAEIIVKAGGNQKEAVDALIQNLWIAIGDVESHKANGNS